MAYLGEWDGDIHGVDFCFQLKSNELVHIYIYISHDRLVIKTPDSP